MDNIRCSAPDRIRVPARPAQHVHRRLPHMRRRTRRSAATIGGGTPDMTVGRAAADRAGARPYRTVARIRVPDLRLKNLETQKLSRLRTMEQIQ